VRDLTRCWLQYLCSIPAGPFAAFSSYEATYSFMRVRRDPSPIRFADCPLAAYLGMTNTSENIPAVDVARLRRLQTWLGIKAGTKPKVYAQISAASEMDSLSYWLEIFFAAGIATFGLVEGSPAVIMGSLLQWLKIAS
jgi:hypothetical protein